MLDYPYEAEREMEASDTEKNDLKEERRRLLHGFSEPEDDFSSETTPKLRKLTPSPMSDNTPDPVSEAIEAKLDEFNITNEQAEVLREALTRIATLSYARGVEDSASALAKTFHGEVNKAGGIGGVNHLHDIIDKTAAAIRSLTPHEKKV